MRKLYVEGNEDLYVLSALCADVFPGSERHVNITIAKSDKQLMDPALMSSAVKERSIECLGFVIDADGLDEGRAKDRYATFARLFEDVGYSDLPSELPEEGLVLAPVWRPGELILPRCALWVMPDNCAPGSWETLLWNTAESDARAGGHEFPNKEALEKLLAGLGSNLKKYSPIHAHKARLRTWLAWSSTPDLVSGQAVRAYFTSRQLAGLEPLKKWLQRAFGEDTLDIGARSVC